MLAAAHWHFTLCVCGGGGYTLYLHLHIGNRIDIHYYTYRAKHSDLNYLYYLLSEIGIGEQFLPTVTM